MKAYKGFIREKDGTLRCRDFRFEVGKTYKYEHSIKLCKSGFHACRELHKVWFFYPNDGINVFYEVECEGEIIESNDSSGKLVCSEITLVREIDMTDVAKFDYVHSYHKKIMIAERNKKYNFINAKGELLSKQWFEDVYCINDVTFFAAVTRNKKYNFINAKGELLSKQWFDDVHYLHDKFPVIKRNGKFNFINAKGELLSKQWFDSVYRFNRKFAVVLLNGELKRIDKYGNIYKYEK